MKSAIAVSPPYLKTYRLPAFPYIGHTWWAYMIKICPGIGLVTFLYRREIMRGSRLRLCAS